MTGFASFGLTADILKKLETIGFNTPTPIQEQAIPEVLKGRDILGTAQTGTGKTGAFGIPLIVHLIANPHSTALVMTPTRELAMQVHTQVRAFLPEGSSVKSALLIGGEAMFKQLKALQMKPRLIIGTPGRINDHLERDTLSLAKTDFLVLDEADRMLDMGFGVQLEAIAQYLPEKRQTLMFSATVPGNIMKLAKNYLNDPVRVEAHTPNVAAPKIKQELLHVNDDSKHDELSKLLGARSGQIIVFVKTKHGADRLARRLDRENHSAEAIHGDLRQGQRDRVIRDFRKNETRILVATDVAARGLDIPNLETVINFDLPQNPEDYIHRIGRTGRNGAEGEAICLIAPSDRAKWAAIDRLLNPGKAREKGERSEGGSPRKFGGAKKFGGSKGGFGAKKFGDKPTWKSSFGNKSDRPQGDRPQRFERSERPSRSDYSDRPARSTSGEWAPEKSDPQPRDNAPRGDRPAKSGDRPHNFSKPKTYGDKPAFGGDRGEKRSFGDRSEKRSFGDRPSGNRDENKSGNWKSSFGPKKEGSRDGAPREGGFKQGGFKQGGFKKASGGFNQGGPRKPRPARSA